MKNQDCIFDEMEDMIMDSPRYNEAAKGAFMTID